MASGNPANDSLGSSTQSLTADRPLGILIADADDAARTALATGLAQAGFVVWQATNGYDALELFRQRESSIDLVLLDLRLDAVRTLQYLRSIRGDLRCCFLSEPISDRRAQRWMEKGAQHVFIKPVQPDSVVPLVHPHSGSTAHSSKLATTPAPARAPGKRATEPAHDVIVIPSLPSLTPGAEPIPGYKLHQILGRGGFAEVWEARNESGPVALKFMACADSTAAGREIRVIRSIQQLNHPGLIRIDQVRALPGYIVIAMELAEASLLDLLDAYQEEFGTPVAPEQVCLLLHQAAETLDFLNTRQHHVDGKTVAVQHCDIKPSNLLLFGAHVKLADFGLATLTTASLQPYRRAGTLAYAAPEVFQGRLSDHTDQYALAVSYCQMRGGRLPFHDTPRTFLPSYVRPEPDLTMLPASERPIIARGLSRVPHDRWPSCVAMLEELTKANT